jgi:hypothetical protein
MAFLKHFGAFFFLVFILAGAHLVAWSLPADLPLWLRFLINVPLAGLCVGACVRYMFYRPKKD